MCVGAVLFAALLALFQQSGFSLGAGGLAFRRGGDPVTERKRQLFADAENRPSDIDLVALFSEINESHFGGQLPPVGVQWQEHLEELNPGDGYTLEGLTDGKTILVSSALRGKEDELRRTLCHEAVHIKLNGSSAAARHDEAFQAELRRVFESGCFQAVFASDAEKDALKQWLDRESARLKQESATLDARRRTLDREVREINEATDDLNARIVAANARGAGWPSDEEQEALRARRTRASERTAEFNAAVQRQNEASAEFSRQAERFRLMVAYPHGVDDDRQQPNRVR